MLTNVPNLTWKDNKKLTVVNLFGGPGVGKSFLSRPLVHQLCTLGVKCQPVQEYAKELTWDNDQIAIQDQIHILGNQHHLLRRLMFHGVDVAVLDSSLLLGLVYASHDMPEPFYDLIWATYDSFNNVNILVTRDPLRPYEQMGRNQDPEQAKQADQTARMILDGNGLPYLKITSDQVDEAVEYVLTSLPGAMTQ
jgi:nicotinamide riboside kinase